MTVKTQCYVCQSRVSLDGVPTRTPSSSMENAPTIPYYAQSADLQFQCKNADLFKLTKPCSVNIKDMMGVVHGTSVLYLTTTTMNYTVNKGIDVINLANLLHHIYMRYFKNSTILQR